MKKNKILKRTALFAFVLLCSISAYSQLPEFNYRPTEGIPVFYYDIVSFAKPGNDSTKVSIYTRIRYDELQFVKTDPGFKASYELVIVALDKNGDDCAHKIITKEVSVPIYDKTNSRKLFNITETDFLLLPGIYKVKISLTDLDAKKTRKLKTDFEVPKFFTEKIMLSDILLADTVFTDSTKKFKIKPNVFGNYLDTQKNLFVYSEIYTKDIIPEVQVTLKIVDKDGKEIVIKKFKKKIEGAVTPLVCKMDRKDLSNGRYNVVLTVESSKYVAGQKRPVMIHWLDMPSTSANLDAAIEQMRWIAKKSFIKKLLKMKPKEKKKVFSEFWKELDPSPGTDENEIRDEYYRRIDIANENFGYYLAGWKTERGMVYVILGPPDDVERHPFEMSSKPYEVWFYQQFNHNLVFVDEHGYGEYRLLYPEQFWEMVSRAR
ncbi:GWxTD domain-containing protein [bacterium]|nr:GWxTD domain-containing protein [bacterium]